MNLYDYSGYGYFGHLCELPYDVLDNLATYFAEVKCKKPDNDLSHYKQWYIQTSANSDEDVEISWRSWNDHDFLNPTKKFFSQYVNSICKFRFSELHKDHQIEYHSRHMLPRIHIPLNDSGSIFVIKDKNVEYEYRMEYGHAHFVNVTYLHKVKEVVDIDRYNCFFSFRDFANIDIKGKFLLDKKFII